ncbi:MAG: DUF1345 domain-containing protein [Verrucomicrobia bacterium]|nr:MAG: DUF1345 domain-containing protein [Verrucomicrobiota bacterium]
MSPVFFERTRSGPFRWPPTMSTRSFLCSSYGLPLHSLHAKKFALSRLIFALVVIATSAAMMAVALLLRSAKTESRGRFTIHLLLSVITVILSWFLMHSVFGLRYAHEFYGDSETSSEKHAGGLLFPGQDPPDYSDFAYFSFVIGMTCQVSDVQVTSGELRNLALLHGILSFAFNTVILALTVNIVAGLW